MEKLAKRVGFVLTIVVMFSITTPIQAEDRFELRQDDVVVFAGGTNMLRLQ